MANVHKWLVRAGERCTLDGSNPPCHLPPLPVANACRKRAMPNQLPPPPPPAAPEPAELRSDALRSQILRHLTFTLARDPHTATTRDWWISTAMAVRDHILEGFIA